MTAKCKFILFNGLLLLAATTSSALAGAFDFMYPESHSSVADDVDFAFDVINWISVISFMAIIVVMVYFAIRYRATEPGQRATSQVSHSTSLELVWSIPPILAVMWIFWLGYTGFVELRTMPTNAYEVKVEAYQFGWQFTHPNGRVDTNVLQVPSGENVLLTMQSRDTIHSLYVPAFRVKQDLLRGRFSQIWFKAKEPTANADYVIPDDPAELDAMVKEALEAKIRGEEAKAGNVSQEVNTRFNELVKKAEEQGAKNAEKETDAAKKSQMVPEAVVAAKQKVVDEHLFEIARQNGHVLYCTEFCGDGHSVMLGRVIVHKPGWTAPDVTLPDPGAPRGEFYFKVKGCVACHDNAAMAALYPQIVSNGIWGMEEKLKSGKTIKIEGEAGEEYLLRSILYPAEEIVATSPIAMPAQAISEEEAKHIVEYLKTLPYKGN